MREKVIEHLLLGKLGGELLARDIQFEVLRSESDAGVDIVFEAGSVVRHVQLKSSIAGGATRDVPINLSLAVKPSGCVIWLVYDPAARDFDEIRWFGGRPGDRLPDLGNRVARHSRANAAGIKAERSGHRLLPLRRFERLEDAAQLADRLFGIMPAEPVAFLRTRLTGEFDPAEPCWLAQVRAGDFSAIPSDITWSTSTELAHLIDGYRLVDVAGLGDPSTFLDSQRAYHADNGVWRGDAVALWSTLFLEHRAARFAGASHAGLDDASLDDLCVRLRSLLVNG
jgi:hypothetical protein